LDALQNTENKMAEKTWFHFIFFALIFLCVTAAYGQGTRVESALNKEVGPIRSSPAYAETLLRRTELQSDLEAMLPDYTEQNPKVLEARFEIGVLTKDMDRMFGIKASEVGRLTEALGKMIVRRAALAAELYRLQRQYSKDHPEVLRGKRRVDAFDAAIKEILG
jgi:hypothetical protein